MIPPVKRHFVYYPQPKLGTWGFEANTYSRLKHGCVESIDHFTDLLLPIFQKIINENDHLILCCTPYKAVPNTANLLLISLLKKIDLGPNKVGRLKRTAIFPFDYSTLEFGERQLVINDYQMTFDESKFKNRKAIIIDDSLVTGAHEKAIIAQLGNVVESLEFVYILNLVGLLPEVEFRLNNEEITKSTDLLQLFNQPGFILNNRALRLIMNAPNDEFKTFINCVSHDWKKTLYELAKAEEYDKLNEAFASRLSMLYLESNQARSEATSMY